MLRKKCGILTLLLFVPLFGLPLNLSAYPFVSETNFIIDSSKASFGTSDESESLDLPAEYLQNLVTSGRLEVGQLIPPLEKIPWANDSELNVSQDNVGLSTLTKVLQQIQSAGSFLNRLDGENLLNVPFGIAGEYGDFKYQIAFDNIALLPDYATMDVIAGLYHPLLKDTLYFTASSLKYNNRQGFIGEARLQLFHDMPIEINTGKSALVFRAPRTNQGGTYIKVSCDGIEEIGIASSIFFNPDMIRPVDESQRMVQAYAEFEYRPESGLRMEDLSISPFYFGGVEDFAFSMEHLTLDLDEKGGSSPDVAHYLSRVNEIAPNSPTLTIGQWTGFFCDRFSLTIDSKIVNTSDGDPLVIEGHQLVIDDLGFSGLVQIEKPDLLSLDQGNIGGWSISVDAVHMDILANSLRNFGFSGFVHIPILGSKGENLKAPPPGASGSAVKPAPSASLAYKAAINRDDHSLELTTGLMGEKALTIPAFLAEIAIYEGSYLSLVTGDQPRIEAFLQGKLALNGQIGKSELKTPSVQFHDLYVSNQAPYFGLGSLTPVGTEANLGAFKLGFENLSVVDIEPQRYQGQMKALSLDSLSLDLGNVDFGDALTVRSSMNIFFGLGLEGGKHTWHCRGVDIEEFSFRGDLPGIESVEGTLSFYYDDPIYHDGFAGGGIVKFDVIPATIKMHCLFASTGSKGYRFSYVDAAAQFDQPISESSGAASAGLQIQTLVGGYYRNMHREQLTQFQVPLASISESMVSGGCFPDNRFIPQEGGWGIRGGIIANFGNAAIAGLRIEHEVEASEGQGVASRFFLEGMVEIMPSNDHRSSPAKSRIVMQGELPENSPGSEMHDQVPDEFSGSGAFGGYVRIQIIKDQNGKTFEGAFGIQGEVASVGINFTGEYYKSPDQWHLFIGRPERDKRLKVRYAKNIGEFLQGSLEFSGYFMVGNSSYMPNGPPPPYSVNTMNQDMLLEAYAQLHDGSGHNIFSEQKHTLREGKAFAFGAAFNADLELDIKFLVVSAGANVGFDVLMFKGFPACNQENISEVGLNGWYMSGQFYAGIAARVGIRVSNRVFEIFNAGVAATIQGAGFNPTYGSGAWTFRYKILWIRGSAKGLFRYGQPCNDLITNLDATRIIEEIKPGRYMSDLSAKQTNREISINSDFYLTYSVPVQGRFKETISDFETGEEDTYRLSLLAGITLSQAGKNLPFDLVYADDDHTIIVRPKDMLVPGEPVRLQVKSSVRNENGSVLQLEDLRFEEDTSVVFNTDPEGLNGLTEEDIIISYPLPRQQYFHPGEYDKMMVDFGKPLNLSSSSLLSALYLLEDGRPVLIEEQSLEIQGSKIIQPVFQKLETNAKYLWRISAISQSGESSSISDLEFSTSRYHTFKEKMEQVEILTVTLDSFDVGDEYLLLTPHTLVEELEHFDGNALIKYLSDQYLPADGDVPVSGMPIRPLTNIQKVTGEKFFTRFETRFRNDPTYPYFSRVLRHVPYNQTVIFECQIDDAIASLSDAANPEDRTKTVSMRGMRSRPLSWTGDQVHYDILSDFRADQAMFKGMYPEIPMHYSDCTCRGINPSIVTWYQPGKYSITARYFIPGFNEYSSSYVDVPFQVQ